MLIPSAIHAHQVGARHFHKADSAFNQPSRAQTLQPVEALRLVRGIQPVELARRLALLGEIQDVGHQRLHAIGHFCIRDGRLNGILAILAAEKFAVLGQQHVELGALDPGIRIGGREVFHGHALVTQVGGLVRRGQEAGGEIFQAAGRHIGIAQKNVARQIAILQAQPIRDPGAKTGIAADVAARVEEDIAARVERKLRLHGTNDRQRVHMLGDVRKQFANGRTALAVTLKLPKRTKPLALGAGHVAIELGRLAVKLGELRLGIKTLHVRDTAGHEEEDDVLGARAMVRGGDQAGQREERESARGHAQGVAAGPTRATGHRGTLSG